MVEHQTVKLKIKRFVKFTYTCYRIFSYMGNDKKYSFDKKLGINTLWKFKSIFDNIVYDK